MNGTFATAPGNACFPNGFQMVPNDQLLAFHSERGSARNCRFAAAPANACFPYGFKGFPITVRFLKPRNGIQETARCFTCPRTRECLFSQWFSRSAIADPSRAARHRIDTFPGSRTPPCSKRYLTNGFAWFRITVRFLGLFFLEGQK